MAFMEPQIMHGNWCEIESTHGAFFVPKEDVGEEPSQKSLEQYIEGSYLEHRFLSGWGARLSAPGFLDCTDWVVFDTEQKARAYLREAYGEED